jgi:hypothetical protein
MNRRQYLTANATAFWCGAAVLPCARIGFGKAGAAAS